MSFMNALLQRIPAEYHIGRCGWQTRDETRLYRPAHMYASHPDVVYTVALDMKRVVHPHLEFVDWATLEACYAAAVDNVLAYAAGAPTTS
jgi:hypothetical protein